MTWWGCLLLGYGLSFMSGVAAHGDGPEEDFWPFTMIMGTVCSGVALIAWAIVK